MRIGFHTSSLLLHDQVAVIGELAAMGYQSVVVRPRCGCLDPGEPNFSQQMLRLAESVNRHDMTLLFDTASAFLADPHRHDGPSLASDDAAEAEQAETWIGQWIEIANEFRASTVTFNPGMATPSTMSVPVSVEDEPVLNRLAERLNRLADRGVAAGVRLALRPASGEAVATVAQFERLGQWLDEPDALHLAADVAEMLREGEFPVADRLARNLSRLACVYLCERDADGARDQLPTNCEIDMRRITRSLRRLRFGGPVIARIEGHSECGLSLAQDALEWFIESS